MLPDPLRPKPTLTELVQLNVVPEIGPLNVIAVPLAELQCVRSATVFTVAVDKSSRITEPGLQLKWNDAGKRSVFLGRFGDNDSARSLYVDAADLCGPSQRLF